MKLRSLRERDLIAAVTKEFRSQKRGLIIGIGDDAAVIQGKKKLLLLTKDLLIENVHFIVPLHPPYELGRKALNVNLSDIAAMGGRAKYALLGLGLRKKMEPIWVERFFLGFKSAAQESGVELIGGDISASNNVVISVTVVGTAERVILRNGARPGDLIFVSGYLGDAAAGLKLLKEGFQTGINRQADALIKAFLDPKPQLALGRVLSLRKLASAMIDTSDGLSVDLQHICEESCTGADVYFEKLPLSPQIRVFEKNPLSLSLHGGEDYQLLFTAPPKNLPALAKLERRYSLHWIGRITGRKKIRAIDRNGRSQLLEARGYQHFSST
jgi:thiamine-monophosphate kinase